MSNIATEVLCRNIVFSWKCLSLCILSALDAREVRFDESHEGCDARGRKRESLLFLVRTPLWFLQHHSCLSHPEPHMSARAGLAQQVKATNHSNHLAPYLSKCRVGLILCPSPH